MDYDYLFKVIIIGDSGVGKSCILSRFTDRDFNREHDLTIGVEYGSKLININKRNIKMQIWDTAGQERFRSITRSYYRNVAGIIMVYDMTNRNSFNNIEKWLDDVRKILPNTPCITLVGNKSDLEYRRNVSKDEGINLAYKHNMVFIETSARNKEHIGDIFTNIAIEILEKVDNNTLKPDNTMSGVTTGMVQIPTYITTPLDYFDETKKNICCNML
jgi:small GTP-binding protein